MGTEASKVSRIEPIVLTDEATVVGHYERAEREERGHESEAQLEARFIEQLQAQAYEYVRFSNEEELIANLRTQLEALNDYAFSDAEWKRFYENSIQTASNMDIVAKTRRIQEDHVQVLMRDNGQPKNIRLIDKQHIHNNRLQVTNQYVVKGGSHLNRYDVTVLVNGLPLVHIELKRRGVPIREAFNQISRYQRDSFWAGAGLFGYVQIFVISNGTYTKYYSNTTRLGHVTENADSKRQSKATNSDSFEFTMWWSDANNEPITDLADFSRTFFAKHTLLAILTRYCVFNVEQNLLVMRPYQIAATEMILRRINSSTLNGQVGTIDAGGYIWHTTGSGKTLTSFKTAKLAAGMEGIDKVLFVVDRKDLDAQTIREYNRFAHGTVSPNSSSAQLAEQITDPSVKIIVTTIQKLSNFVSRHKKHKIFDGHVVFIFDECHRSQFGDMHTAITRAFRNYHLFGFTGTPIFPQNSTSSGKVNLRTTEQAFGDRLHHYTIVNAIGDKNVLPFRVDYIKTVDMGSDVQDKEVSAVDRERAMMAPERISMVVDYIRAHFDQKTKREKSYTHNERRLRGFNSLFATASIPAARAYYEEFARQQQDLPSDQQLSVGIVFSATSKEEIPGEGLAEESMDTSELSSDDRAFLDRVYADHNARFGTNYDDFESYYKNISDRLKDREIDLVIVVNMFLTGFDAKTLNTLWVDKSLRSHGLIQAYSRTNRILNSVKTYGNIVCFRDLQQETDEAIALFGNKDASGTVTIAPYHEWLQKYLENLSQFRTSFQPGELIFSESAQHEFVKLFGEILRLRNILTSFDEFENDDPLSDGDFADYRSTYVDLYHELRGDHETEKEDINDDLVFEIELIKQVSVGVDYILLLVEQHRENYGDPKDREISAEIRRALNSNPSLHSKRDLIEDFVRAVSPGTEIDAQWQAFIERKMEEELSALIVQEGLQEAGTRELIATALREGELRTDGTVLNSMLRPMSRFHRSADGESRAEKKERVIAVLSRFVERFSGLISVPA